MAELTNVLKFKYSLLTTFVFVVLSSSQMYKLTSKILPTSNNGCQTSFGLMVHSVVFLIAIYGLMFLKI
jgi:hypothetical protein